MFVSPICVAPPPPAAGDEAPTNPSPPPLYPAYTTSFPLMLFNPWPPTNIYKVLLANKVFNPSEYPPFPPYPAVLALYPDVPPCAPQSSILYVPVYGTVHDCPLPSVPSVPL